MVRPIVRDLIFLQQKSEPATKSDQQIIVDLLDTLKAHLDRCVGMAANMIGEKKRIIAFENGPFLMVMVNPVITSKTGEYQAEEGCLSLDGVRSCTRYREIEVDFLDQNFQKKHGKFSGYTAQIIQHEIQHFSGELI